MVPTGRHPPRASHETPLIYPTESAVWVPLAGGRRDALHPKNRTSPRLAFGTLRLASSENSPPVWGGLPTCGGLFNPPAQDRVKPWLVAHIFIDGDESGIRS